MIKSLIKNLFRFLLYSVVAFILWSIGLGWYIIDVLMTTLLLVSYFMSGDLSKYFKLNSKVQNMLETDFTRGRFMITVLIYVSGVLSPIAMELASYIMKTATELIG